jgi:hypothetical protein
MDWEAFEKHKPFAGEKKPSMLRRRVGHDYESRHLYFITMTVEDRRPILGTLVGDADAPDDSPDAPRVVLSPLGEEVQRCWFSIHEHNPEVEVLALQLMPDHLHGILYVKQQMEQHLGLVLKGFKIGCNKAYRRLGYAATVLQQREPPVDLCRNTVAVKNTGFLFARNYNDHILEGAGELERWFLYLRNNPRRLAIRRKHPDYFHVCFNVTIGSRSYDAIGNRFLLQYPEKVQVQCSRSLTAEQKAELVTRMLAKAKQGAVVVSPAISKGEQAVMRAVLDARLPLIFLSPWGFNEFSHPGHQYYDACAEGRFLILAPWPHQNRRFPLTRKMCLLLNAMTADICGR